MYYENRPKFAKVNNGIVGLQLKAKLESIISFVITMSLILQSSEVPTIQCVPI